jgi:transposase-like protein
VRATKIMHTMTSDARTNFFMRRFCSPESKLQVVGERRQPGTSIAAVALRPAINANIAHR